MFCITYHLSSIQTVINWVYTADYKWLINVESSRHFLPAKKTELIFMRSGGSGASPGNLSQLFSIVHEVAVEVFSDQDKAMTLNRWKLHRIDNIATGIWVAKACQCLYKCSKCWKNQGQNWHSISIKCEFFNWADPTVSKFPLWAFAKFNPGLR